VKTAMMITFMFLVLFLLALLTFTIITVIRKAEFEEALVSPGKEDGTQEEGPR
jgi:Na+-transporting methylmalonyl-CoA/oxaloacetate decarboxylase gamma subunit